MLLMLQTSWESSATSFVSWLQNSIPRLPSWLASRRRHYGDQDDDDDAAIAYDVAVVAITISMRARHDCSDVARAQQVLSIADSVHKHKRSCNRLVVFILLRENKETRIDGYQLECLLLFMKWLHFSGRIRIHI